MDKLSFNHDYYLHRKSFPLFLSKSRFKVLLHFEQTAFYICQYNGTEKRRFEEKRTK